MESSSVVFFRAFVMLACLIVVPLAAIFGSAFPEVVKSVLIDRFVGSDLSKSDSGSNGGAASFYDRGSPAPYSAPGGPSAPANAAEMAPRWPGSSASPQTAGPAWGSGGMPAPSGMPANPGPRNSDNTASFAAAVEPTPKASSYNQVRPAVANDAMGNPPLGRADMAQPIPNAFAPGDASRAQAYPPATAPPAQLYPPATSPAARASLVDSANARSQPTATGQAQPDAQPERFVSLERKLREYGATYYLLETWGNDGELYRFHCKMAVANNPNFTQRFEATDRDALKAMAQVLSQVEAWRSGRGQ